MTAYRAGRPSLAHSGSRGLLFRRVLSPVVRCQKIRMNRKGGQEGGIAHKENPVDISNLALVCPTDGPIRAGYRLDPGSDKVRVCRKCGMEL